MRLAIDIPQHIGVGWFCGEALTLHNGPLQILIHKNYQIA